MAFKKMSLESAKNFSATTVVIFFALCLLGVVGACSGCSVVGSMAIMINVLSILMVFSRLLLFSPS